MEGLDHKSIKQMVEDLNLLLWASAWLNTVMFSDRWEFERGIRVPAKEHVPDLQHPDWPKARDLLSDARADLLTNRRKAA